jgi:malonyl-CoA/methylmalonyl-CoA synthetase
VSMANLFDLIRCSAVDLDKVAIEGPGGSALSYGELFARAARAANALVALGVGPSDRVAVQVDKSPDVVVLYLACLRAGAVLLPLNTAYTPAELSYFLEDAEPALMLCRPAALPQMRDLGRSLPAMRVESLGTRRDGSFVDLLEQLPDSFTTVPRGGDDLAAILYTSGTTGRSKGAMLTHDNLLSNARTLCDYWRFTSSDRLIHALPIFHTHGLFVASNVVLLSGASMDFLPKFDPDEVLRRMQRATVMMGVPTFYVRILQHEGLTKEATAGMRLFISGSAPLLAETHRSFFERTGHAILERYGMTETNMNTSNPYEGERIAGTVGFPLPGVELRITDPETGRILPDGDTGMIEVKGPNVFQGYWRMPEKTAAEFRSDGFFITGDLGRIDAKGYVHIVGRGKDLVISGGYNIYPKEVETEIDQLDGVLESAVIGVAHPDFGEGVTAIVVRKPHANITERDILDGLGDRLARYKQPKQVIFVDELPRNTMGKVQKAALRETFKALFEPGS